MPSIDAAMARSLQAGVWETTTNALKRSLSDSLVARQNVVEDTQNKVEDVTTALSSWDNCMQASFCKYPVIAIIIVGSLILLSILTCIVRCACCAKSCCCSCFSCFKCCGNCCGCCDSPEDRDKKKNKYLDAPFIPPNQGYRTEAPMTTGFGPAVGHSGPPQYAEFDVSKKKGTEDSLPQMPSWEGAGSRKVEMEQEAVEMNNLNKPSNGMTTGVTESQEPTLPVLGAMAAKPTSPQGRPIPTRTAMMGNAPPPRDQYSPANPYEPQQNHYGADDPYGLPPAGMAALPTGRNSPGPMRNGYGPNDNMAPGYANMPPAPSEYGDRDPYRHTPSPGPGMAGAAGYQRSAPGADPYGQRMGSPGPGYGYRGHGMGPGPNRSANNSPAPYGMDPRMRNSPGPRGSPRPGAEPYNRSPVPGAGGFGNPARTYSPASERQFTQSPRPLQRPGPEASSPLVMQPGVPPAAHPDSTSSSPIVNNGGFDFTSGFSRPQTANSDHYNRRPSESKEPAAQEGYPGYKPYRPAQEGWSGV